jgi:hypothetical protein
VDTPTNTPAPDTPQTPASDTAATDPWATETDPWATDPWATDSTDPWATDSTDPWATDTPTSHTPATDAPTTHALTVLARCIESLLPAGAQPAWAEIIGPLDNPEHMRWHPDLETMVGFLAPPSCHAITVVGQGWGRNVSVDELRGMGATVDDDPAADVGPGRPLLAPGERRRVRVVCLMTRAGNIAGYLRDGPTLLVDEPPSVGRIPDFLRRCFGLPTPPPAESTDGVFARIWLANIGGAGESSSRPLGWSEVTRLHPAMQVAKEGGITIPSNQFSMALRVVAQVWDWTSLAEQARGPGWLADFFPPGAAGWMDEGILSRWLLGGMTPVDVLWQRATPYLAPSAAKRLRTTLRKLGVLTDHHPVMSGVSNTR